MLLLFRCVKWQLMLLQYLLRMEQIGLHLVGKPESFMSCAQIKITNGGNGKPSMVTIPGHVSMDGKSTPLPALTIITNLSTEPGLSLDIYWPIPTAYIASSFPTFVSNLH
jgi:Auxiliary Activity family 9 (formerly GH61)